MDIIHIAHILVGPVVGIVITVLAFSDHFIINQKVKDYFVARRTPHDLAEAIERMISASISLATFLGNVYLFIINLAIATIVFPLGDLRITISIGMVLGLIVIGQTLYIFWKYRIIDIGEIAPVGNMVYDRLLRWEQVLLSASITVYFVIGICLS